VEFIATPVQVFELLETVYKAFDAIAVRRSVFGKSSWVTHRPDKVVAKGKGELQTYWATPRTLAKYSRDSRPEADHAISGESDAYEI
jgi:hypothetical protein